MLIDIIKYTYKTKWLLFYIWFDENKSINFVLYSEIKFDLYKVIYC